mmetsp:Transcript_16717/g.20857  ORF Transcript_16717/g.20857 Transcript_16717/m.20857 type:complete len:124 (-) Transcript_16717:190-561(-)|eukprot:CAMPEP_0172504582 /NCGR_PEP_ID=MMETSP1066-20121228/180116_1 /TAXON_ID=671091 /ORGANISM="Coscinodiscus wailesii, Strain CCMP2513" /LENGTH=123 /DNA_ID=CAMNT_0013280845 /DNA_START=83 /DNA_END=454 /DNA_ORIENTATION=+
MLVKHAAIIGLFVLLAIVTLVAVRKDEQQHEIREVPQQMIGGMIEYRRQGPWPECLDMSSDKCKDMIEEYADDVTVIIISNDTDSSVGLASVTTKDLEFDPDIVYVVEHDGIVIEIPGRGWRQ